VTVHEELFRITDPLSSAAAAIEADEIAAPLAALRDAVATVDRSFSGSWMGYHSRVYYEGFQTPPPGDHFSKEWGLMGTLASLGSVGEWVEYPFEEVKKYVFCLAANPDLTVARAAARVANEAFNAEKAEITSAASTSTCNTLPEVGRLR
jgi:hypothetical protein